MQSTTHWFLSLFQGNKYLVQNQQRFNLLSTTSRGTNLNDISEMQQAKDSSELECKITQLLQFHKNNTSEIHKASG